MVPVHASWLNQVEIYFSVVQRKVVSPNDFTDLNGVVKRLTNFETHYNQAAKPFKWKFTTESPRQVRRHSFYSCYATSSADA